MKTYNEMDKEIIKLLDMEGMPLSVYAARYIEKLQAENAELRERLDRAVELPSRDRVWYIAKDEEGQESYIIPKPTSSLTVEELKYEMDKKYFSTREAAEARLTEIKENAELRERLDRAVELPYAPDSIDIGVTKMMRSVRDNSVELRTPIYIALKKDTLEEASAMLKELEQNAAERNDNADAIIYGLRSITGALKADKNHDER